MSLNVLMVTIDLQTPALSLIQTGELFMPCYSFHCFEVEGDFSLVGVVDVFIADHVGDHSALDLGLFLSDQAEPNSHQRVDVSRLKKRRKNFDYCPVFFYDMLINLKGAFFDILGKCTYLLWCWELAEKIDTTLQRTFWWHKLLVWQIGL